MIPSTVSAPAATAALAAALALIPAPEEPVATTGTTGEAPAGRTAPSTAEGARADTAPALPSARLDGLDGTTVDVRSAVDGPAIVNFWATWCGPCRREMPELARLHADLRDEGLQVVGIAVSSGSPEEIRSFADRHDVEYRLLRASREWSRRHFRVFGMPTTLVVDGDGRIQHRLVGPQTAERLRQLVEPLLDGTG